MSFVSEPPRPAGRSMSKLLGHEVATGIGGIGQEYRKLIRRHRTSIRSPAVAFAIHLS
jgi:hypothetical protein